MHPGSRVVVLQGRNFPSFGAGDQGRVIRVDKEALNCEVGAVTDCPGNMSEGGEQIAFWKRYRKMNAKLMHLKT